MEIERSDVTGFCYGVRRALDILEKEAQVRGSVESLGEVVHNTEVMRRLTKKGVRVVNNIDEINSSVIVLGTHGTPPEIKEKISTRHIEIIDTTCPFVHRAQTAARKQAEAGFFVIVFGDPNHVEVKGIIGWAKGNGVATTEINAVKSLKVIPRRIAILSQTTQIPVKFSEFVKGVFDTIYYKDSEIRIIDTICHEIRDRQSAALELAKRVNVMLVIGGRNSANTTHLAELCATIVQTHKIETADQLQKSWFQSKEKVGITAGASTADEEIDGVEERIRDKNQPERKR